ncbi:putative ABC transport system permease protein [Filimonas zeae]|uniref:ABC transporter permease n=1 Tax=Filimonas zeae TaxID=1737353 RepID=A0A917IU19_9BACT|nr:ABC transporter permease [Filimonas zeae]MDR6338298.1 putative ABC transport system permease protein [Filimonas zeae]GGH62716.1 ABC transporter permease [Filimonas zeae]
MLKNYLKIAWRNLSKHKAFTLINILGLAVGMTACFLIFLYVSFELSYDQFHTKGDRVYRLSCDIKTPSETIKSGVSSWAFGPNLKNEFPEIETYTRVAYDGMLVKKGDIKYQEEGTMFADSTFFKVFDYKLVKGNAETALKEPLSVVFTETAARKYFGNENPIGQTVQMTGDLLPAKVTGVVKDFPANTLLKAEMIVSMSTYPQAFHRQLDEQWGNFGAITYLLLKPGTDQAALNSKFPSFLERRVGEQMRVGKMFFIFSLEPMKDLYLHATRDGLERGSMNNVYVFSIIAVFILLIACINFVNLTTARAAERAKEVGIRKVAGAQQQQLALQFLGESLLLCLAGCVLAIALSSLLMPLFNQLAGKTVSPGIWHNGKALLCLVLTSLVIGLLAGFYPAAVLSNFQPITVLKGRFSTGMKGVALRKGLVLAQFTISISLIIATIIVYRQMHFMRSHDLGFNQDQVLVVETSGDPAQELFKKEIAGLAGVQSVAVSSSVPGGGNAGAYSEIQNKQGDFQVANLDAYFVDFDYIPQFKMKMVAGRAFSKQFVTDTTEAMVINEATAKLLGFARMEDAIGKRFKQWGREGAIIGVVKNFHFRSLQEDIKPLTMRIEPGNFSMVSAKIAAGDATAMVKALESKWNQLVPNRPFRYFFLDDYFDKQYRGQQRFGNLFLNFAILAIFISCLGLLGLASYSTLQRTREIGVRKVMGASVTSIINLLSVDFLKLVVIAFVIAVPVSWYLMHKWLQDFAYKAAISWWIFAAAGGIALLTTLITISFQAVKAAIANPVRSLRAE